MYLTLAHAEPVIILKYKILRHKVEWVMMYLHHAILPELAKVKGPPLKKTISKVQDVYLQMEQPCLPDIKKKGKIYHKRSGRKSPR